MTELTRGMWVRHRSIDRSLRNGHVGQITDQQGIEGGRYYVRFGSSPGGVPNWVCDGINLIPLDEREAAIAEASLAMGLIFPETNQSNQENQDG